MKITDKGRLDFLQHILKGEVTCRNSSKGRGFRLHQTRDCNGKHKTFKNVRDAIDFYMKEFPKENMCSCKNPESVHTFYDFCSKCKKPL